MKFRTVLSLILGVACLAAANTSDKPKVTYSKDIAPILNRRCVECHRAGEVAPMAFTSYKEVRPWAKSIKERVLTRTMPPWFADPHFGDFKNDRRLTQAEMDTIAAWAAAGAPEGDPSDLPAKPEYADGWNIGKPDLVIDFGLDYEV